MLEKLQEHAPWLDLQWDPEDEVTGPGLPYREPREPQGHFAVPDAPPPGFAAGERRLSRSSRSTVAIDQLGAVADVLDKALTILIEKRQLLGGQRAEVNQAVAQLDLELEDRVWEAMELCYQEEKQQLASGGMVQ